RRPCSGRRQEIQRLPLATIEPLHAWPLSGSLYYKVDMHGIIRENYEALVRPLNNPCVQQSVNVAVNGLYIPINATGNLSDRQGALSCHGFQDLPALRR